MKGVQIALARLSSGMVALAFNDHQRPVAPATEEGEDETPTRVRHRLTVHEDALLLVHNTQHNLRRGAQHGASTSVQRWAV